MRETCLLDLAQFWFNIIASSTIACCLSGMANGFGFSQFQNTYRDSSPATVCLCLDVIGAYVSWIDINLITNDSIMSNLFTLFTSELFRSSVTDCFNSILRKGMDPFAKTEIIENFIKIDYIKKTLTDIFAPNVTDFEFVSKFSNLINTMGTELIDAFKKLKGKIPLNNQNSNVNEYQALSLISTAIESKFSLMCQFLSHKDLSVCQKVHSFARDYIQWIKNTIKDNEACFSQNIDEKIIILLSIIVEKSKYPPSFNLEDEFFDEFRKSTKVMFDNLILINVNTVISFICDKIVAPTLLNWKSNSLSFADIEVALYYFYLLGENMSMLGDIKQLENLVQLLVSSSISSFPNAITQSFYFDLIFRYEKCFNSHLSYLSSQILISFLDERGLRNTNMKIRSKVCRIFNKFVKSYIKSKGNQEKQPPHFTEDILNRLQDFVKLDITFDNVDYLIDQELEHLTVSSKHQNLVQIRFEFQLFSSAPLPLTLPHSFFSVLLLSSSRKTLNFPTPFPFLTS